MPILSSPKRSCLAVTLCNRVYKPALNGIALLNSRAFFVAARNSGTAQSASISPENSEDFGASSIPFLAIPSWRQTLRGA
jgi:hypothetical protein